MTEAGRAELDQCVDTIESGDEYFLAYAAQGRRTDRDNAQASSEVRDHLEKMVAVLDRLDALVRQCVQAREGLAESSAAFLEALRDDAAKASGVFRLALSCDAISSQLIDNLNASVHVRALLTDLFIVDEALR